MEIEEKVWDAFTDLNDEAMADMAERATGARVFRKDMLWEVLRGYGDRAATARIIKEAEEDEGFSEDDEWMYYDDFTGELLSNDDLMELLDAVNWEIVTGIMDDGDLMYELGLESEEEE